VKSLLIVGCGDIGKRVAREAAAHGYSITALVRSAEKSAALRELGMSVVVGDLAEATAIPALPTKGAAVLYCVPPPGGGLTDPRVENFCSSIAEGEEPASIVYLSTSGVYGDCGDAVVTEETPPNPQTSRARRRFAAETTLLAWGKRQGIAVTILRVTGIYGPNRLPMDRILSRHPLLNENEASLTNRIHADDLAQVCLAALTMGADGDIFNVSDGQTSTMTAYFNAITDLLGLPRLPQISLEEAKQVMAPLMLSYMTESRRMENRKMLEKLGVKLRYPTLEAGLRASIAK
jgi:nucleoside-diphosphate-sugar epimerase